MNDQQQNHQEAPNKTNGAPPPPSPTSSTAPASPSSTKKLVWEREITFEVPPDRLQETIAAITAQESPISQRRFPPPSVQGQQEQQQPQIPSSTESGMSLPEADYLPPPQPVQIYTAPGAVVAASWPPSHPPSQAVVSPQHHPRQEQRHTPQVPTARQREVYAAMEQGRGGSIPGSEGAEGGPGTGVGGAPPVAAMRAVPVVMVEEPRFDFSSSRQEGEGSPMQVGTPVRINTGLSAPLLGDEERGFEPTTTTTATRFPGPEQPQFQSTYTPTATTPSSSSNFWTSVVLLCSSLLGVGLLAVPRLFALLGIIGGILSLSLIAFLFLLSFRTLLHAASSSSINPLHTTYSALIEETFGGTATATLEIAIVVYTFGAAVLSLLVLSDVIVGDGKGGLLEGWEGDRGIVLGVLCVIILAPLSSFKQLRYFTPSSFLGVITAGLWAVVTLVLVVSALAHGNIQQMRLWPDTHKLGGSWFPVSVQFLGTVTVLLVAAAAHTNLLEVAKAVRPRTSANGSGTMMRVGSTALLCGFGVYLVIGLCSYALFGSNVQADVLKSFTVKAMEPLIGATMGRAAYLAVRLAYIISLVAAFPLLLSSLRDTLWRLLFWQELTGPGVIITTYLLVAAVLGVAVNLHSIWGPIQLVGALGGSLVAFIFPGALALRRQAEEGVVVGGLLVAVGIILAVTGVGAWAFLPSLGED